MLSNVNSILALSLLAFVLLAGPTWRILAENPANTVRYLFFITSSTSGSLVIDTITAGGKLRSPVAQRIVVVAANCASLASHPEDRNLTGG